MRILLATSDSGDRCILTEVLQQGKYEVLHCYNSDEVWEAIRSSSFAAILIDPEFNHEAIKTALAVQNDPAVGDTPIMFLLPARPEMPAFLARFRTSTTGVLTRPYGRGEVLALLNRIAATN